jgi:NAD(P)-dependent dehydrogenase (short-subunit alcohol dehydrogenase family)
MDGALSGRHVVITGGTGALGAAVVARFVEAGALCHVPSRHAVDPKRFALAGHKQVQVAEGIDLADEAVVRRFYAGLPGLWASVHLAGGFSMAPVAETSRADFDRQMAMNAASAFVCCREAVGAMRRSGKGGRIVNVAARPGVDPRKGSGMIAYAASKAALVAITLALAEEVKGEGIRVNAVAPSTLDTPANRQAMPKADPSRWLSPEAAAETILHLASPANREINGAVLPLYAQA